MEDLIKYMRALVLLQVNAVTQGSAAGAPNASGAIKPEILLVRAGFSHREVATMIGKTPAAVAKAVSRAKVARTGETESDTEVAHE
jgi:hypothetical protein